MKPIPTNPDPVALYRRAYPHGYVGMVYHDLLRRHVTDCDLWAQVLADTLQDDRKRRYPVPYLIQEYQRLQASIKEIEAATVEHTAPATHDGARKVWDYDEAGQLRRVK